MLDDSKRDFMSLLTRFKLADDEGQNKNRACDGYESIDWLRCGNDSLRQASVDTATSMYSIYHTSYPRWQTILHVRSSMDY